ncbi:MAG: hypothetical protein HOG25_15080 [Gammaproteobacteria bacterium]|jgi:hypothetical protein|nr:hypothetical protein [Gammaproteobacteria bacterium]
MEARKRAALCLVLLVYCVDLQAHPLKLSLCQIEYASAEKTLTIELRLFLMDVNEALVFDPDNNELGLGQPDEVPHAEGMLLDYLNRFFYIKANGKQLALKIKSMSLNGQGNDAALGLTFSYPSQEKITSIEIKNAVFTDLFFDQSNVVYVHVDDDSRSLMLNKKTPVHKLVY